MADFDGSTFYDSGAVDYEELARIATECLPAAFDDSDFDVGSPVGASSSSFTSLRSTAIDVLADELAVFKTLILVSMQTIGHQLTLRHYHNGNYTGRYLIHKEVIGAITGYGTAYYFESNYHGAAGNITFDVRWANAGAGNYYSYAQFLTVEIKKHRTL